MSEALTLKESKNNLDILFQIQSQASPTISSLHKAKSVYDIDLNTRKITTPNFVSISKDHKSRVIYFRVDRYYDYMDLSETVCIIQYFPPGNTDKIAHTYVVPFYDVISNSDQNKIIFPWVVGGAATQSEGTIEFAIRFYRIEIDDNNQPILVYNLNMEPTKSKILYGLQADDEAMQLEYNISTDAYLALIDQLSNQRTAWTILT